MNHKTFMTKLRHGRAAWEATIAKIPQTRLTEPALAGGWSVKDVIAHVTWFEEEMVAVIEARALVGSELWLLPADERNRAIYEEQRERPLADILAGSERAGRQLLQQADALTEEELINPARFKDMPPDWVPWQIIAGNSFNHYPDHIADMEAWLSALASTEGPDESSVLHDGAGR